MHRRHSLKKSAEFQRVRALKQSWAHPLLVLYVAASGLDIVRVGISVSKRIGKAVARNRVKRLIREAVRLHLPSLPRGYDLVFVARGPAAEADYARMRGAVETLLIRSRLLPRDLPAGGANGNGSRTHPGAAGGSSRPGLEPGYHETDRSVSD